MTGPILEKSLCGYSLKTSCKIIGWLGVVGWGTLFVVIAVNLALIIQEDDSDLNLLFISIVLGLPLLFVVYNILVLLAVQKRRRGLLLPYMFITMLHIVGGLMRVGASIRNQKYEGFVYALKAVFDSYFLLLVASYYSQLRIINQEASPV